MVASSSSWPPAAQLAQLQQLMDTESSTNLIRRGTPQARPTCPFRTVIDSKLMSLVRYNEIRGLVKVIADILIFSWHFLVLGRSLEASEKSRR